MLRIKSLKKYIINKGQQCGRIPYIHILVNKNNMLSGGFIPDNLIGEGKTMLCAVCANAFDRMCQNARKSGIVINSVSGYRSFQRQRQVYIESCLTNGIEHAIRYVAPPGASEHQTGLAIDVSCDDIDNELTDEFGATKAGQWLEKYSHYYGFILRYPKGWEDITGFGYEPWHFRYVGNELAIHMKKNNIYTLEQWCCCYGRK